MPKSVNGAIEIDWFLPTNGDGRHLTSSGLPSVGLFQQGERAPTLDYLRQVVRAAELGDFDGIMVPTASGFEDPWLITAVLAQEVRRLRFLLTVRPGLELPAYSAHRAATLQLLSEGRLDLHVVSGSSRFEQRSLGDFLEHDERYARTAEFLEVFQSVWSGRNQPYHGRYYRSAGGAPIAPQAPAPAIYFGGASQAASAVGYPEITDLQDLDSNNGYSRWLRNTSLEGKRQDSAHTYLHPLLQDGKHANLHVLVEHMVQRVLFDDQKRATGVELTQTPEFTPTTLTPQKVTARKTVVLSSGACGSPLILERSGVGSPEILTRAKVPVLVDLPGVGHDYQDHHLAVLAYKTALGPEDTPDRLYSGELSPKEAADNKNPMVISNSIDIAAKIRPTDEEAADLGPEFQAAWDKDFRDKPNKPLMLSACMAG